MANEMNQLKEVAERIRELREILGYSVEEMAGFTDVSVEDYTKYESGDEDFNFTFIYKVAKVCKVDPTDILTGTAPVLSGYSIVRNGGGLPIAHGLHMEKDKGFKYLNLAPNFKGKLAEPFKVTLAYSEEEEKSPIHLTTHAGQEMDIMISGEMKIQVGSHTEVLHAGDTIYYNSSKPHGMVAVNGSDAVFYAVVFKPSEEEEKNDTVQETGKKFNVEHGKNVCSKFVHTTTDENGVVNGISFTDEDKFNFAFDCVDAIAEKNPDKTAMVWVGKDKNSHNFTFADMKKFSNMTANYLMSLGIKKGDKVMLVLKRHYQFWFAVLALHKIGAVVIPATNQLVEHDFDYRYKAAGVKAILCTADGDVSVHAENAAKNYPDMLKIMVGGNREGWLDFNAEMALCSDVFERKADSPCGDDPMIMLFTSGTTGYPRIAAHSYKYALGHYLTAKYWHNVDPDGVHFTISDTGWGKALWGKLYGQWLCEGAVFVYDFDRFVSEDILPMFKEYNITTFCAPPTMYRFFIKEDLSKYDLSSIKHATTAGEALNPEVVNQFKKATGLTIMEAFGQTETTMVIGNFIGTVPKTGSMGKPSPLYDVTVLRPDGTECAPGEVGEICIRTTEKVPCGLFMGYYRDEEKTKAVWYDGYYHTGDQATVDEDGYYWYVGRIDDVIKSSGYRIGPFEIENVIMELPYVLECAITGVPDPVRGQVVKATIVLTKNTVGTDELKKEIQTYVKTNTAPYKYPRVVEFVEELPKTISGKIRRVEIRNNDNN